MEDNLYLSSQLPLTKKQVDFSSVINCFDFMAEKMEIMCDLADGVSSS